jgi:hypothetical protein
MKAMGGAKLISRSRTKEHWQFRSANNLSSPLTMKRLENQSIALDIYVGI